jgi:hypothetical protein
MFSWLMRFTTLAIALVLVLVASGCSGGGDDDDRAGAAGNASSGSGGTSSDAGGSANAGSSAADGEAFGSFKIVLHEELAEAAAHASATGQLFDAATTAMTSKVDSESGDCTLLVPDVPACRACDGVCVTDGDCQPAPRPIDAGEVAIEGLAGGGVKLTRDRRMFFYQAAAALPFPPCQEGADVTLAGPDFDATVQCVAPLVLITQEPVVVKTGSAVQLEWAPPEDSASSRIAIKLDISHHGGKKGEIACDVPDTGSFALPEALVSKLISLGVAAQPTIGLKREATAAARGRTSVRFTIVSPVERAVDTGFRSCVGGEACPEGTTCDSNTELCR